LYLDRTAVSTKGANVFGNPPAFTYPAMRAATLSRQGLVTLTPGSCPGGRGEGKPGLEPVAFWNSFARGLETGEEATYLEAGGFRVNCKHVQAHPRYVSTRSGYHVNFPAKVEFVSPHDAVGSMPRRHHRGTEAWKNILIKAGVDPDSIRIAEIMGGHPGGTAAIVGSAKRLATTIRAEAGGYPTKGWIPSPLIIERGSRKSGSGVNR
jgi:hypothetical protein